MTKEEAKEILQMEVDWDREQMLKEAVEGEVSQANDGWKSLKLPSTFFGELSRKYEVGDKVRIIIVKED